MSALLKIKEIVDFVGLFQQLYVFNLSIFCNTELFKITKSNNLMIL